MIIEDDNDDDDGDDAFWEHVADEVLPATSILHSRVRQVVSFTPRHAWLIEPAAYIHACCM